MMTSTVTLAYLVIITVAALWYVIAYRNTFARFPITTLLYCAGFLVVVSLFFFVFLGIARFVIPYFQ